MEPHFCIETGINIFAVHRKDNTARRIIERTAKSDAKRSKAKVLGCCAICALFFWGTTSARATTIVVVYTPKEVSIAADSLGTFSTGPQSVCKVYQAGEVFIGVAGAANDPITKFNVANIVFAATNFVRRFTDKMTAAANAIEAKLLEEARQVRSTRPKEFDNLINPDIGGVSIILIGRQDGILYAIGQKFMISADARQNLAVVASGVQQCPGTACAPDRPYTFWMGSATEIQKYMSVPHPRVTDTAASARHLVQMEIDAHAIGVGPPIDVLRMTMTGSEWIQQKKGCPIKLEPR